MRLEQRSYNARKLLSEYVTGQTVRIDPHALGGVVELGNFDRRRTYGADPDSEMTGRAIEPTAREAVAS